jgi:glycosyltransferase involved in cell wall biosynthesis
MRLSWWRWYRHLFVYTDREVEMLKQKGFTTHDIVGMNNGLDQRRIDAIAHEWTPERLAGWREHQGLAGRTAILSCARLEAKNRFELGIEALAILLREHPDLVWCVIGDGVQKDALTRQAEALGVSHAIRWVGAVTDDADLAPWFLNSELLLHPASIGLTLLHAFGYGLPVVTHGDPREHNPEFAAFEDGGTGRAYVGGAGNLADAVRCCLADADGRARMSARALRIARESHNVDVMAERFAELAKRAAGA